MNTLRKNILDILLFILWIGLAVSVTTAHADDATGDNDVGAESVDLVFGTYLAANMPEQDVYFERVPGSGEVYRPTRGAHDLDAPLYKTLQYVPHNPFDGWAVGPYPKGEPLGMTLAEWLRHRGTGSYSCTAGEGRLETHFAGLVPNGVYTMWHAFTAIPATRPFSGFLDLPLGARDGSTSVFVADDNGEAVFRRAFSPCLQMSDVWTTALLAITYHSDGRTHAASPGDYGRNSHMPLFVMLPRRDTVVALAHGGLPAGN